MNLAVVIGLLAVCALMMVLESRGLPTTLALSFKGDIKRESRWLAQYGQFVCTAAVVAIIWQLDPRRRWGVIVLAIAVSATSLCAMLIKRTLGRIRPGRENAGKFLGPSFRHSNHRESFPSSHSACAVALTVMLTHFYPQGAITFWTLALICAGLRYLMDAHWPSDILGGIALGYLVANFAARVSAV
jgi:membrane-associated phospholipid phosphatase